MNGTNQFEKINKVFMEDRKETKMRKCFTLIELLITVAIIAILAGMLLPALSRARDKAMSMQCMNNVKQLTMGNLSYANDFGDATVPSGMIGGPRWFKRREFTENYCGIKLPHSGYPEYWHRKHACPVSPAASMTFGVHQAFEGGKSYGLQHQTDVDLDQYNEIFRFFVKLTKVKAPSTKFMFMEVIAGGLFTEYQSYFFTKWNALENREKAVDGDCIAYRHGEMNRVSVSFLDGHVESASYKTVSADIGRNNRKYKPYAVQ